MSISELLAELLRDDIPRDGVTLSGGDPLAQAEACAQTVKCLKAAGIHVIVYAGSTFEQLLTAENSAIHEVLALTDVLVDGPFVGKLKDESLAYRGSSNQRVIDVLRTRQSGKLCLTDWD